MILVHHQRDVRPGFHRRLNQVFDEIFARILACPRTGLKNHRCADLVGSAHDRLHLFQVVDVEGWNAVTVACRMIKQLAHGNKCHFYKLLG